MNGTSSNTPSGVPIPIQLSIQQVRSTVKLIYRGEVFYGTRIPQVVMEESDQEGETIELIYHGHTYHLLKI
jgi:hypothetical protein